MNKKSTFLFEKIIIGGGETAFFAEKRCFLGWVSDFFCEKVWSVQKKAVPLQPLL